MTIVGLAGSVRASEASEEGSGMRFMPPNLTLTLYSRLSQNIRSRRRKGEPNLSITLFQYCGLALMHWKDLRHCVGIPNYRETLVLRMFEKRGRVSCRDIAKTATPVRLEMKAGSCEAILTA